MIQSFSYEGNGMQLVYSTNNWCVGIKNWKVENDLSALNSLERHMQTDELFVLLQGACRLLYLDQDECLQSILMEANKVYSVPSRVWHNTLTCRDSKLVLIENSHTSAENSEFRPLNAHELKQLSNMTL